MSVVEFNTSSIYKDHYMVCFNQSDTYGRGDFMLIDKRSGEIQITCLFQCMSDIPYLSDVPQRIMDYVRRRY